MTSVLPSDRSPQSHRPDDARLAALGELAAGAAHEINNPLFAILGLVEFLLRDAEPGSKAHERLELVQTSAHEIKEIVRVLNDFARAGSGGPAVVAVDELVRRLATLVEKTAAGPELEIELSFGEGPFLVDGVPGELELALLEPLLRARRERLETAIRIELTADADTVTAVVAGSTLTWPRSR